MLISQCLEKSAKNWFYLIEKDVNNLQDFEIESKERYWSKEIQTALRRNL